MLVELSIKNLAVIEKVRVNFSHGFHVLTGETGAGKSIIIDALTIIAGGRASADLIRHGCDKTEIEAMFDVAMEHPAWDVLEQLGVEYSKDEYLIIRREITKQGKNACRINGQLVNLSTLRTVGDQLVNIHGQHEHQSLLKTERHIDWLDMYGANQINPVKKQYQESYKKYTKLNKALVELQESASKALQMADLYRFQIDEISSASLKVDEEKDLQEEKTKLANAEKLMSSISQSYEEIYSSGQGLDAIGQAMNKLESIKHYDSSLQPLFDQVSEAYYQLEDAAHQIRAYRDEIEFNPTRLEHIEQRLDTIFNLKRKYGSTIEEILAYLAKITEEMDMIENKDQKMSEMKQQLDQEWLLMNEFGQQLSRLRKSIAEKLAIQIEAELADLQMERTRFSVQMNRLDLGNVNGLDEIEFMISPNPGEPMKSLGKIASGGELSRIMLALKSIFAEMDQIPVLVFDEVDTGVSGRAAQAIAEKLSDLSDHCQVFSITHLPQVACMADGHFLIEKVVQDDRTFTKLVPLDEQIRVEELARMLGGVEVTSTTLHHASEMIGLAKQRKLNSNKTNQVRLT